MLRNLPAMQETSGKVPWRRPRQPTPVFLPGESRGQRSLAGYSPWGHKRTDWATKPHSLMWKGHSAFIHFVAWGTLELPLYFGKSLLWTWVYKYYSPCCQFFGGINQGLTFLGLVITLFHLGLQYCLKFKVFFFLFKLSILHGGIYIYMCVCGFPW